MAAKIMGGTTPCMQTRHRGRVNSSALRWPQRTVLGNADVSRRCGDSPTSYSVLINVASELIVELVYGVVCVRRDFSRIRRQMGKLRKSQMSLIGAEACHMNAACALGLCVAGLRGQLRKLPFGVSVCYAGLSPSRGSSWLGGLFWGRFPDLSSEFEDSPMALSTATFVSDVVSTLPPAVAILHAVAAITDVLPVRADSQLQGSRTAVVTAPAPTPHLPQVEAQRLFMDVLGAGRGLHLGASATTLCNVRLFSSRMRSAESLLLNLPDP